MRVADYIFKFLTDKGLDSLFMVSGGQAMFLVDAVAQNTKLRPICTHHEQAAGMAAEAYSRLTGKLGIALVTAGPGSINITNGLVGAWTDSAPIMIISGQSALSCVQYQQKTKIRQFGIQGINIKPLVESATKFFITVDDPSKILYYMSKAYHLATTGRPGPVWIDVPLDVQRMSVPETLLDEYIPPPVKSNTQLKNEVASVVKLIQNASRPIILVGQGVRLAKAAQEFINVIKKVRIPILTSRLGIDLIDSENELYVGRPGTYGERAANFAIQNCDLMIVVGCRLATALVGHDPKNFGKNSKKIVVDIDLEELEKPGIKIDHKIHNDAKVFFQELYKQVQTISLPIFEQWIGICQNWKKKYPVVLPSYKFDEPVNSYFFIETLSRIAANDDMILVDTGTCFHVAAQSWKVKENQRFLTTGGISSMGYWAAGIGACIANNYNRTIVITGDGSLQMNLQEFATIKHNNLPIKVFIFNNNGYLLIRHTQRNFMEGRFLGEGPNSGVWCPDSLRIAESYGIKGVRLDSIVEIDQKIKEVLEYEGPCICDVMTPEWQLIIPRISSEKMPDGSLVSHNYDDMFPHLDKSELDANTIN